MLKLRVVKLFLDAPGAGMFVIHRICGAVIVSRAAVAGAQKTVAAFHIPELAVRTPLPDAGIFAVFLGFVKLLVGRRQAGLVGVRRIGRPPRMFGADPAFAALARVEKPPWWQADFPWCFALVYQHRLWSSPPQWGVESFASAAKLPTTKSETKR